MPVAPIPLAQVVMSLIPVPGYEDITVADTAIGLTPPTPADGAIVQVQANPVRMRADGGDPTATSGVRWVANDIFAILGLANLRIVRFIREGGVGTDGVLSVHYITAPTIVQLAVGSVNEVISEHGYARVLREE